MHKDRNASVAFEELAATRLGKAIALLAAAHPKKSGIVPLSDARDAFAARMHLANAAERTLDVQYYIWRLDMTGTMLFDALRSAAERGVKVRLLLDDNNTSGLDATLAELDSHPNIEVRLFNPFSIRKPRWVGYLTDFSRANRRMHNKSFTADRQATIIGGRNIGDEYFGAADDVLFADLDVIAIGAVVNDVAIDFERYWISGSAYPASLLLPTAEQSAKELRASASRIEREPAAAAYINALRASPFVRQLVNGALEFEWTAARMVSDSPEKGLGLAPRDALLSEKLKDIIGEPSEEVELVSPYFVPTATGVDAFAAMVRRGVRISVLTNALEATDVAVVHAGYAKWRKALLKAGIALYELRRASASADAGKSAGVRGSSGASLHAKTFAVDGSRVFIGSFNFDPRSTNLNTEMGFVIDSQSLAQQLHALFDSRIPLGAYQVCLSDAGRLYWLEHRGDAIVRHDMEPGTRFWQRALVHILSLLPIDWLL